MNPTPKAHTELVGWGSRHNEKRLLTLFLGCMKSGSFIGLVKNVATVDVHGYVYYREWILP
jgi:hypothetical protein